MRTFCIVESPFEGGTVREAENRLYLNRCIADAIHRGEIPFASHKMYVDSLDDENPHERERGMTLGFQLTEALATFVRADRERQNDLIVAVYDNRGITRGMKAGIAHASRLGLRIVFRTLDERNADQSSGA